MCNKIKSFCISKVLLVLSVVELKSAISVYEFSCQKRNLTITVDDRFSLYIDGAEITGLPNEKIWNRLDVVDLPCTTRLVAIYGRNSDGSTKAGILASTDDNYVLTNSSWKCSNVSQLGWKEIDFDDSAWKSALEFSSKGRYTSSMTGVSSNASWIWLDEKNSNRVLDVYCRKRLGPLTGDNSTCSIVMVAFLGVSVLANIALISALCVLRLRKKTVKDDRQDGGQSGANAETCQYQAYIVRDDEHNDVDRYEDLRY